MKAWVVGLLVVAAGVVAAGIAIVGLLTRSEGGSIIELEVGSCFDLPTTTTDGEAGDVDEFVDVVDVVDCDRAHEAEVVLAGTLNPGRDAPYPSDAELFSEVDRRCLTAEVDRARFGVVSVVPNESAWEPLAGRFVCVAIPYGGEPVTGSLVAG